jgi:hypothetical protein
MSSFAPLIKRPQPKTPDLVRRAGDNADHSPRMGNTAIATYDANVPINDYIKPAEDLAKKVLEDVKNGKSRTWEAAKQPPRGETRF